MDKEKIARINALAKKSREEGLTDAEKAEQAELRTEYLAAVKGNMRRQLDAVRIKEPDGTLRPLKPKN